MTIDLGTPSPRQAEFLADTHKYVAFGGARGGGKSWAVRVKAVLLCCAHPGITCMIVRKTYPELRENHIAPLCSLLHTWETDKSRRLASYNDSKKELRFPNGSRILFRYCDAERDAQRFQGTETDVLFIDESTLMSESQLKKLSACVRGANGFPKRIYSTCNPGGQSHAYHKRLYIDRQYESGEDPEEYSFIQSLVTDNRALMESPEGKGYLKQLQTLPPQLRDMWLHGRWDSLSGAAFSELRLTPDEEKCRQAGITPEQAARQGRWTHVLEPFDLNSGERRGWSILRSYDFGYHRPFSLGYWAVDYDGVLYRILEMYGCTGEPNQGLQWPPEKQFSEIARFEREHPWLKGRKITGVADPAIWDASRGESVAETAMRHGVYFTPGDNKRIPGWMQVHYRLQFDENGYPRMYVFRDCRAFLRTMPQLQYSQTRPEDIDSTMEDHVADEVRYLCMSRPVRPILPREESPAVFDPLDQWKGKRRSNGR